MAESQSVLKIILEAADRNVKSVVGGATGALGKLGGVATGIAAGGLALAAAGILSIGAAAGTAAVTSLQMSEELSGSMRTLQAQTGATDQEMQGFRDTALDIFNSNWGDSIADVGRSMGDVANITGATGDELNLLTTDALILRDVFEKDVKESVRAVDNATETFGETGSRVFDLITTTIQRTGDPADDLLDTVNEYSVTFADAGFSASQMFGILEAGLDRGAMNFDVVADAVKEFQIRIVDGSETTESALNEMFNAVGEGSQEIVDLQHELDEASQALDDNTVALEEAEGAYDASKQVVDDLSRALGEARRELAELSRPKLAGMDEYDDKMFDLEQQANRVKLSMIDMVPDSDQYEAAQGQLDAINKEMDRVALQRDIAFEPQLRAIEKAATEGVEPVLTFDQAMAQIGAKKGEISELEGALAGATSEMQDNAASVAYLNEVQDQLSGRIDQIKTNLEEADTPAKQFLQGFTDGSLTGADAMSLVIQKLQEIEDPLLRNQIGVDLFGTKWEDLGPQVILGLDPAKAALQDVEGATQAAGDKVSEGLGPAWETFKRNVSTSLIPLGDEIAAGLERATPALTKVSGWLGEKIPQSITWTKESWKSAWPTISDTASSAMETIQPYLDDVKGVLDEFRVAILPELKKAWTELSSAWTQEIAPALDELWESLGLAAEETDAWNVFLGGLRVVLGLVLIGVRLGIKAIRPWAEGVAFAVDQVRIFVDNLRALRDGIERLFGVFDRIKSKIKDFSDSLSNIEAPDWLIPGSPTPFERGLRGISAAIASMPELNLGVNAMPALATAGGGQVQAGGLVSEPSGPSMNVTVYANSKEEGEEAGRGFVDELRKKGLL
jgi:phage-related minor tail protein